MLITYSKIKWNSGDSRRLCTAIRYVVRERTTGLTLAAVYWWGDLTVAHAQSGSSSSVNWMGVLCLVSRGYV